ncbi:MAG: hypothetical protein WDW38_008525 [Sanguina aurantia]
MSRVSFRPRPVDVAKQLSIVRDVNELDNADGLLGAAQLQGDELLKPAAEPVKKKTKEIPVPDISTIPTYTREYLPLFHIPSTYLRGKGGTGWSVEGYVEYDLEGDDEDWLAAFNAGTMRLTDDKLEKLLWRLEVANAEANDRVLSAANASALEKVTPLSAGNISNLPKDEAIAHLRKTIGGREAILREVYEYWAAKRVRMGRPMLRRLIAPTSASDANPLTVFRPREKVHRPQTRRRKENSLDCLEKMKQLRDNILAALEMTEMVVFRESRKRDIHQLDCESVRYQLALNFTSPDQHEAVETSTAKRIKEIMTQSAAGASRLKTYLSDVPGASTSQSYDSPLRRALQRKKRRLELEGSLNAEAVAKLPPPPTAPNHALVFALQPQLDALLRVAAPPPATAPPATAASSAAAATTHTGGSNGNTPHPAAPTPPLASRSASSSRLSKAAQQKPGTEGGSSGGQEAGSSAGALLPQQRQLLPQLPLPPHRSPTPAACGACRAVWTRTSSGRGRTHLPPPCTARAASDTCPSTSSNLAAFISPRSTTSTPWRSGGGGAAAGALPLSSLPWAAQPHLMDLIPDLALDKVALQGQQQARIAATLQRMVHHPHPPRAAPHSPPPLPAAPPPAAPKQNPPRVSPSPATALHTASQPTITNGSQATAGPLKPHRCRASHIINDNTAQPQHHQQQLHPASSSLEPAASSAAAAAAPSMHSQPHPSMLHHVPSAATLAGFRPPSPLSAAGRKASALKLPLPAMPAAIVIPSRSPSPSAPALRAATAASGAIPTPLAPFHTSTRSAPLPAATATPTTTSNGAQNPGPALNPTADGANGICGAGPAANASPSPVGTPGGVGPASALGKRGAAASQPSGRHTPPTSSSNKRGPGRPKGARGTSATEEEDTEMM